MFPLVFLLSLLLWGCVGNGWVLGMVSHVLPKAAWNSLQSLNRLLTVAILLPQPSDCVDYMHKSLHSESFHFEQINHTQNFLTLLVTPAMKTKNLWIWKADYTNRDSCVHKTACRQIKKVEASCPPLQWSLGLIISWSSGTLAAPVHDIQVSILYKHGIPCLNNSGSEVKKCAENHVREFWK